VCDLTEPLGLSQPTVSHHLRVLADAGLLERDQRGRWAFFRLVPERLDVVRRALTP
jgi:ArsR family transcriptional regulator